MRGGARQGAGRKPKGDNPRVTLNCRIDEKTLGYIKARAEDTGLSVGEVIDTIVDIFQDTIKEGE